MFESELKRIFYSFVTLYAAFLCFKRNNGVNWCIIPAIIFSPMILI